VYRTLPHGVDALADIARLGVLGRAEKIVDVGANVGDTVARFAAAFPEARIFAIEPAPDTYARLEQRYRDDPRVITKCVAFSSEAGTGQLDLSVPSTFRRLGNVGTTVELTTLDTFCTNNEIGRIDLLKIDTEGHDLEVITGGSLVLTRTTIVQTEVSMNPENLRHVPVSRMKDLLEASGFRLLGVYDQFTQPGALHLRRADAVFVRPDAIAGSTTRVRTATSP
jgi:FkbM family methyltransferase